MGEAEAATAGAVSGLARIGLGTGWGTVGTVAAAAAILLLPTNTRRTTETAAVDGHPHLGARISRAPGELSGQVTIFARGLNGQSNRDLTTLDMDAAGHLTAPAGTAANDAVLLGRRTPSGSVQLAPEATARNARRHDAAGGDARRWG